MTISSVGSAVPQWTVGDRMRKARETTGLTRDEFAKSIGVSRNTVTKYEAGDTLPKRIVLNAWVLRTGVSADWIATGVLPHNHPGGGSTITYLLTAGVRHAGGRSPATGLVSAPDAA